MTSRKRKNPRKIRTRRAPGNRHKTGSPRFGKNVDPAVGKDTRFKPGESGNPSGRPKRRPIAELLFAELERNNFAALRAIVRRAIAEAKKGNFDYYRDIRETIDGKTPLSILTPTDSEPQAPLSDEAHARLLAVIERISLRQAAAGDGAPKTIERRSVQSVDTSRPRESPSRDQK